MKPFSHLKAVALSDVGKKRKNNEDAFGTFPLAGVFCVADGMGGGDDGEIASAAVVRAVDEVAARFAATESGGYAARDVGDALSRALTKASAWICNRAHERRLNGCGSTFVGVAFDATDPAQALAVHAGDSRLYLLHGRSIRQVTRDHSVAELMGEKDESKVNPMFRSMVVNGIGIRPKADPEFTPFKVAPGDRVLICSDGLSRMVPDKRILSISRDGESLPKVAESLIAAALEAGGVDNVTVVLVEVGDLPQPVERLDPPAALPDGEDAETEDEPTTEGELTGATGTNPTSMSASTLATEKVVFDEELPVGKEEEDENADDAGVETRGGGLVRRRLFCWLGVGLALGVMATVAAIAILRGGARNPVRTTVSQGAATPSPEEPARDTHPQEGDGERPVATNAAPVATSAAPAATGTVRVAAHAVPVVTNAAPAKAQQSKPVATNAVPARPVRAVPAQPAFAAACDDRSARAFVQTLRRLCPKEDLTRDFEEEEERFLKSARQAHRTRAQRDVTAAAVDLRMLALNVESVRGVLSSRRQEPGVAEAIAAWDEVMKGDPALPATQAECARLLKAFSGMRVK